MELNERIKQARKAQGLSQKALAEAVGVSVQAVSQWEGGESGVSVESMHLLAKALSCDISWLMFGKKAQTEYLEDAGEITKIPLISLRQSIAYINNLKTVNDINYAYMVITDIGFKDEGFAIHIYEDLPRANFRKGDLLIFDTGEKPVAGDIVLVVSAQARALEKQGDVPASQSLFAAEVRRAQEWVPKDDGKPKSLQFQSLTDDHVADDDEEVHIAWIVGTLVERRTYSRRSDHELRNLKSWLTPE